MAVYCYCWVLLHFRTYSSSSLKSLISLQIKFPKIYQLLISMGHNFELGPQTIISCYVLYNQTVWVHILTSKLTVWPWANSLTSVYLDFCICKWWYNCASPWACLQNYISLAKYIKQVCSINTAYFVIIIIKQF